MSTEPDNPLVAQQCALNNATRGSWDAYAGHRRVLTDLIVALAKGRSSELALLGAGNCNDVELAPLTERYTTVRLVDIDAEAVDAAVERQPPEVRAKLVTHAPVDLSGIFDDLVGPMTDDAAFAQRLKERARQSFSEIALPPVGTIVSTCLLSQLLLSLNEARGAAHPDLVGLANAIRDGHLELLVEKLEPGGRALLVTDIVSSDTAPEILSCPMPAMPNLVRSLIQSGNYFTGTNPYGMVHMLENNPAFRERVHDARSIRPWRWHLTETRAYLVCAVHFRRK